TGEKRTVSMTEVDYAGPVAQSPQAAATPTPAPAPAPAKETPSAAEDDNEAQPFQPKKRGTHDADEEEERAPERRRRSNSVLSMDSMQMGEVSFVSNEPGLLVYAAEESPAVGWRRPSMDSYRLLCTTPCSAALPVGRYRFGVGTAIGSKP